MVTSARKLPFELIRSGKPGKKKEFSLLFFLGGGKKITTEIELESLGLRRSLRSLKTKQKKLSRGLLLS